ncbi:MAG: VOC family protein [Melioribacteraceae bacterium]|nr:VOC family protein [Melioribacteraceae bacterium]MCF8353677.1 VOC family protein [Melioribacteraceae bacterium]MCF8394459.1 VOC family protein [Melioribacteraceae bacterium]MCF8418593.1 VOC family protein [Melioribacteraceae bacterium]
MNINIGRIVILVNDYDKAFEFYKQIFFAKKLYDETTPEGQRFLHISFSGNNGIGIWFLKTDSDNQKDKVGKQTAGQPTIVFYTDDIEPLYERLQKITWRLSKN